MSGESPVQIIVYDKTFQKRGTVGNPIAVTIIPKWIKNGVGTATISVAADHARIPDLIADGARVRLLDAGTGQHLMSGRVARFRITGPKRRATIEFDITDDAIIFQYMLGWTIPGNAITAQDSAPGIHWTMTAPAEDVLLAAIQANGVDRLDLPLLVPASEGRGPVVKARVRFQSIHDRLIATEDGAGIENAGLGFGVRQREQDGTGLEVYVWEPRVIPQTLNEDSGVIETWGLNKDAPTVSRVVVGGSGEGDLRVLRERIDTAVETAVGWKYEVFRDARDTDDPTELYARADETIAEGAAKSGLNITLSETKHFIARPDKLWVGDQVTMELAGIPITDRLGEVTLSSTADGGFLTRSRVGDVTDSPDRKLSKKIRQITRRLRIGNSDT